MCASAASHYSWDAADEGRELCRRGGDTQGRGGENKAVVIINDEQKHVVLILTPFVFIVKCFREPNMFSRLFTASLKAAFYQGSLFNTSRASKKMSFLII